MKFCTDDCNHFFDTKDECLKYEQNCNLSHIDEEQYLLLKINSQTKLLNTLLAKYTALTQDDFQAYKFDGKVVIKPEKKRFKNRYTIEDIRHLF